VRSLKESDYIDSYNKFIEILIKEFDGDTEFKEEIDLVKEFIKNNKPKFYSLEVSS
jgi:hypothetical protein